MGAVAFFGAVKTEKEIQARNDYASTPEWNLTTLSFFYLCPLFYVILRVDSNDIPTFTILNSEWRATVLGVGSFVFVIMVALFGTTTR